MPLAYQDLKERLIDVGFGIGDHIYLFSRWWFGILRCGTHPDLAVNMKSFTAMAHGFVIAKLKWGHGNKMISNLVVNLSENPDIPHTSGDMLMVKVVHQG